MLITHRRRIANGRAFRAPSRQGFTLIELLVVTAIIGLLAAITIGVVGGLVGNARKAATQSTLKKVHELVKARVQALDRYYGLQVKNPTKLTTVTIPGVGMNSSVYAGGDLTRARVIYRKALFKVYLPQTWLEAVSLLSDAGVALNGGSTAPLANVSSPATNFNESSEVLYFVLTKANLPGYEPAGGDAFNSSEVQDTDADGFPEFVDAWGQPLRFYRWPTRIVKPTGDDGDDTDASDINRVLASSLINGLPPAAAQLNQDLDDPLGMLSGGTWMKGGGVTVTREVFEVDFHTVLTYSTPLIVSAGPDNLLGLGEPHVADTGSGASAVRARLGQPASPTDFSTVFDNITNLNTGAGGQ